MAFQPKNLSALAYANGFTSWHYRAADSIEQVEAAGYFDGAAHMLRLGDKLSINAGYDRGRGTATSFDAFVTKVTRGSVEIQRVTEIARSSRQLTEAA